MNAQEIGRIIWVIQEFIQNTAKHQINKLGIPNYGAVTNYQGDYVMI